MKNKYLLILALFALLLSNAVHSQTKFPTSFSTDQTDSLQGFDELGIRNDAIADGIYGIKLKNLLEFRKRLFIDQKYGIGEYAPNNVNSQANGRIIGGGAAVSSTPCVNEGFETGNISGWNLYKGRNTVSSCSYVATPTVVSFPTTTIAVMKTTPFLDTYINKTIPNSPFTGNNVIKLNDEFASGQSDAVRITQTMPITNSNFLYEFSYLAVMATQHQCCQQTYMQVALRNSFGTLLSCPLFTFAPPPTAGPLCSSSGIIWSPTVNIGGFVVSYNTAIASSTVPAWQKYSIDLTQYIGQSITVEVTVSDCQPSGHWGYAYFDSNCNQLGFTLNGSTFVPAPTQTVNLVGLCGTTATISAQAGLGPYIWNGPGGSGITNSTLQTISTSVAGNYSVSMTPPGSCLPITRVINLTFAPPTTVAATPATICAGSNATLSATGATQYTWNPGGITTSTMMVNPSSTSIYSLTSRTGTCIGNYTVQVNVNPLPNIIATSPSGSVCSGANTTLSATGAINYTWLPMNTTGSTAVVSPTGNTTYSAVGTDSNGCTGMGTTNLGVSTTPTMTALMLTAAPPSGSFCANAAVQLAAVGGAASVTWTPSGSTAFVTTVNPSVTTIYTLNGASGVCTGSTTITIPVDPGPSMTVSSAPAISCPYIIGTLTAIAPASNGFTWTPPGTIYSGTISTHTVNPATTTTYSVQGINANGCRSTYTVSQVVSPAATPTIAASAPSICVGASVSYTASGGTSYTWNPGGTTGANVSFSPTTTTTYTIISSNGTCTNSTTQLVTVVSNPTIGATANPTAICIGASAALTATGATSYTWNPGASTSNPFNVSPITNTTYTVTGSVAGCTSNAVVSLVVNALPSLTVTAAPAAICPGVVSTISSSGATSYTVNPGALTGANVTVSPAGTTIYTVTGINAAGCSSTRTVQLVVNPLPTVGASASPSSSVCLGGTLNLIGTGASTYSWIPNNQTGATVNITPATSTNYTVIGTSALGCTSTAVQAIAVVANPTVGASANPTAICVGASAALTATGATSYTWNPGASTSNPFNVSPITNTTYTVTGSVAGCTSNAVVSLVVNALPSLTVTATPTAICPGGVSNISSSGATSYTVNPGALTGANVTVSPAGTTIYTVTGINAAGCSSTRTVQLVVNPLPTVGASASPSSSVCLGGTLNLIGTGASTYSWIPNNQTGATVNITPATSTNYTVIGTSALGCTSTAVQAIAVVANPTVGASANPTAICVGASAALTATGATSYTWNPGASTSNPFNVSPITNTTYTVTGSVAGCTSNAVVSLVVNALPSLTVTATPTAICPGGVSNISSSGATSYTVNPGALTGANVTVSPAGTTIYTVTGLNASGCSSTRTVQLVVNPIPSVGATTNSATICFGGSAILTGTGASTYTWLPMGTSGTTISVSPTITTTYSVVGASALSCTNQANITINVTPLPNVTVTSNPAAICPGSSATLTATGATTYSWNTGSTLASITVTTPTTYTVIGTTGLCSASRTINVGALPGVTLTASANPTAICPSAVAVCTVSGGVSYTWSTGANTSSISVSPTSTTIYSVTGANGFGCTGNTTVQVVVNPLPVVTASATPSTICAGSTLNLSAGGASTYTWLPGSLSGANVNVAPSASTIYTVNGTSALGCNASATVAVTVNPNPTVGANATPTVICVGNSAVLTATGATSYTWIPGSLVGASQTVSPASTTIYTVTGSSLGCSSTSTVQVTVNTLPILTAGANPTAICLGASATLSVSGGTSYTWQPGALSGANVTVSPAATTIYTVTGINAAGCTTTTTVQLIVNPVPSVSVAPSNFTICAGGFVNLTATGASVYSWTPGALISPTISAGPTVTTVYTVTGGNAFGCLGTANATVNVSALPVVNITASSTLICPGTSATLTGNGASFYSWSTGSTNTTIVVSPSVTTTYSLVGSNGICTSTAVAVTVSLNAAPSLSIAGNTTICAGNTASLTASGAANYTWNPGGLTTAAVALNPSTSTAYTLIGANAFGCTSNQFFTVVVNPTPNITAAAASPTICFGSSTSLSITGASSYTWNPGGLTGSNVTVSPTVNTVYTVTAANAFACNSQTTVPVTVQSLPVVTAAASPTAICAGASSTLTAVGASSFVWSNSVALATIIVSPSVTTIYSVAGVVGTCTSNIASVTVVVNSLPSLSITANPTVLCAGSSATLTAGGATNYTWSPGGSNATSIVVTPTSTSNYTLDGVNGFGCASTQTLNLVVNPIPNVNITSTVSSVCAGSCATLTAGGAASYTWLPGNIVASSAVVCPTVTTTYTVNGSTSGCTGTNSQLITVNALPVVTATATPASICNGFSSTLTASGASSYSWTTIPASGSSVVVSPTINTSYIVSGTNAAGCVNTQTVSVAVNGLPSITITASSNTICVGSTATLTGSGTLSYTWNPSGPNTSTFAVSPSATTVYTLTGSNGAGCTSNQFFTLVVVPIPTVVASAASPSVCEGFTTNLIGTGANTYTWMPGATNGSLIVVSPTVTTIYTVTGDVSGCSSTGTVSILVNPLPTITANASPSIICNGDASTLTANGALSYTWIPGLSTGNTLSVNPTSTSIYTVVGLNSFGCPNFAVVTLTVLPTPTVFASATSTAVCIGSSATLSGNGASTYTWNPGAITGTSAVISPTVATVYTVTGSNGGCSTSNTIAIAVNPLPLVSAIASSTVSCAGTAVTFTANGANTYTWLPGNGSGSTTSANPTITTVFTVTGTDANGCDNTANVTVSVNALPALTLSAAPLATICSGASATLNANGALNYTWTPLNVTTQTAAISPSVNSTYTAYGIDANGCIGTETIVINVVPIPTINISPLNASICAGYNTTLTAGGANSYTWLPANTNGSVAVVNPTTTTTFTLVGDNGGNCPATLTLSVFVNPLPANVTATCSGVISCSSQVVTIGGATSNTNVSYSWNGPGSFTSTQQTPTVNVWGNYTLNVTDIGTGCSQTVVVNVPTDNSIPSVTATSSGTISCAVNVVTITAAHTTTNAGYLWTGPSTFSSILQSFTTNAVGVYTVKVTDLTSGCFSTSTVAITSHTRVAITASITPATCSLGVSLNNGMITLSNFTIFDKFDMVQAATYTGAATFTNATLIPTNGIVTANLSNPTNTVSYTIRLFDTFGCFKDTTLILVPVDCVPKVLGVAKSVAGTTVNANGTYSVKYKVVIKNYDTAPITNVVVTENLMNTFPAPTSFTLASAPLITSAGSSLSINSLFDGKTQLGITTPSLSSIAANKADTIVFTVNVSANGMFGPFNNRIVSTALTSNTVIIRDSSNTGLNPDPDNDINPTNNNNATPVTFTPKVVFGITKVGEFKALENNTYDVTFTVTVYNKGNDTLRNVTVKDSLYGIAIPSPARYTLKGGPVTTGNLIANTAFDGKTNCHLLSLTGNKLAPAVSSDITFTLNVAPDSINGTIIRNSAYGNALARMTGTTVTMVSDTSNNGYFPDVNANDVCNESSDNVPTILILPSTATHSLFIPEGFSPNGDGINDVFVINGLPTDANNSLTIFNRWGNRVYYHGNYNNTWNGYPNIAGTLGKDKLPQGTYYYILEFKGTSQKPITGFIVLEY